MASAVWGRKVGKTFALRHCVKSDFYATVTRTLEALVGEEVWHLEDAVREAVRTLKRGGVVVLDEFQRMPEKW